MKETYEELIPVEELDRSPLPYADEADRDHFIKIYEEQSSDYRKVNLIRDLYRKRLNEPTRNEIFFKTSIIQTRFSNPKYFFNAWLRKEMKLRTKLKNDRIERHKKKKKKRRKRARSKKKTVAKVLTRAEKYKRKLAMDFVETNSPTVTPESIKTLSVDFQQNETTNPKLPDLPTSTAKILPPPPIKRKSLPPPPPNIDSTTNNTNKISSKIQSPPPPPPPPPPPLSKNHAINKTQFKLLNFSTKIPSDILDSIQTFISSSQMFFCNQNNVSNFIKDGDLFVQHQCTGKMFTKVQQLVYQENFNLLLLIILNLLNFQTRYLKNLSTFNLNENCLADSSPKTFPIQKPGWLQVYIFAKNEWMCKKDNCMIHSNSCFSCRPV